MTDGYRLLEPAYDAWRRVSYSAFTWGVATIGLGALAYNFAASGHLFEAGVYILLTGTGAAGVAWNIKQGDWL